MYPIHYPKFRAMDANVEAEVFGSGPYKLVLQDANPEEGQARDAAH